MAERTIRAHGADSQPSKRVLPTQTGCITRYDQKQKKARRNPRLFFPSGFSLGKLIVCMGRLKGCDKLARDLAREASNKAGITTVGLGLLCIDDRVL